MAQGRNSQLRELYRDDMRRFPADIVVFLDEAIFNEKTSWRTRGRAPVGEEACYEGDLRRGDTWSICAATTIDGWVCHQARKGYFKIDDFVRWLYGCLFPALYE